MNLKNHVDHHFSTIHTFYCLIITLFKLEPFQKTINDFFAGKAIGRIKGL